MTTGSPPPNTPRLRIMIVEDEPDIGMIVAQMLGVQYEVVRADNGLEALERLNWYQPDLTVMDLMMPVLDGFDTTRAIKKDNDYVSMPVMFLTARKDNQAVREALMAGGDVYLEKPFDPPELLIRLQEMVNRNGLTPKEKRYSLDEIRAHFENTGERTQEASPPTPNRTMSLTAQLARAAAEPRARILVLHDSEQALKTIKNALKNRYEVVTCQDPEAALDKITAYQPDVLALQVEMPGFDGLQFAQLLRINRQLKVANVLFLTGAPDDKHQQAEAKRLEGILLPFVPLDVEALVDKVQELTRGPNFHRQRKRLEYREILRREEPADEDF